eukprot:1532536-Ditylum_brightwellii.AAC.1
MTSNTATMNSSTAAPSVDINNQNLDKTPVIPAKEPRPKKNRKTMTINKHKLKITFTVGLHEDIKPREKFAPLPSFLIWRFPSLTLEEWGSTKQDQSQSITLGANLPFEQK